MSEVTDQKPTGLRRGIGVLAESLNKDLRLVSEEVVGAEILATKEVIENIGIFLDTLERLDNIRVEQVRWFFEDFATTYKRFAQSQDFPYVVTDHRYVKLRIRKRSPNH